MRRDEMWNAAGIPRRHREGLAVASGWPGDVEGQACVTVAGGGLVGLVGRRGTGKTQLAAKIAWRWVYEVGRDARYTRADDMFQAFKHDIGAETEGATLARYSRIGLLVIDELQERGDTEYEARELGRLLDKRYANMLPTVLIANLTAGELAKELGASVVSRMQETGRVLVMDGVSFRAKGAVKK